MGLVATVTARHAPTLTAGATAPSTRPPPQPPHTQRVCGRPPARPSRRRVRTKAYGANIKTSPKPIATLQYNIFKVLKTFTLCLGSYLKKIVNNKGLLSLSEVYYEH